jgi:hypothetical protein
VLRDKESLANAAVAGRQPVVVVRRLLEQLLHVLDQVYFPTGCEFLLFMFLDIRIDHYPRYPHEKMM